LTVNGVSAPNAAGLGSPITVGATIKNLGAASGPSLAFFYLSADDTLSSGDIFLGSAAIPAIPQGNDRAGTTTVTIPGSIAPGTYNLIAKANGDETASEVNLTNNTRARPIVVGPDLVMLDVTVPATGGRD
jgi:hypothetical protein